MSSPNSSINYEHFSENENIKLKYDLINYIQNKIKKKKKLLDMK